MIWRMRILAVVAVALTFFADLTSAIQADPCSQRSCYPATGNLLIGREDRLNSTSTCGVEQPQRYCIVSHLENREKCFDCDSSRPYYPGVSDESHRIQNIVTESLDERKTTWWQSENGQQNVSISLSLEAEFHFTHLIMTFKSFRPAAMYIERSSDYGKTWKTYRYFAYDCETSFPEIKMGPPHTHSDVICTERYSAIEPSTGGEVVLKVLSPHIRLDDPYSDETQDLIRITNIRVTMNKLHTLGDDLLDFRPEIDQKYYYAIYDMVVRGSCSCYGHAQQCVPIGDDGVGFATSPRPDMVHGKCVCAHHTSGRNCEVCEDFYNDTPWMPATDSATNECQRCECNQHASRCHFDRNEYEASNQVSGGVCDDCQHNTMGKNCHMCKPYFYRLEDRPINDPYACDSCRCNYDGSKNEGICDQVTNDTLGTVAGACHCKKNVNGTYCDVCKNGFWKLDQDDTNGCTACDCLTVGTPGNLGCDKVTGDCQCKRHVTGEKCDKCLPDHYGLSAQNENGCDPCNCDLGGSSSRTCDLSTGQCPCLPHFTGLKCDRPDDQYFCANIDYLKYEAENANMSQRAEIDLREPIGHHSMWTGAGYAKVFTNSLLIFNVGPLTTSMKYSIVLRYESKLQAAWEDVQVTLVRDEDPDEQGPCANNDPSMDFTSMQLMPGARYAQSSEAICIDAGRKYEVRVLMGNFQQQRPDMAASVAIDSMILSPPTSALDIFANDTAFVRHHKDQYERYQCRHQVLSMIPLSDLTDECRSYICPIAANVIGAGVQCECDPTGSKSGICSKQGGQCECKENIAGRTCDRCHPGTYGFGPQGCTTCECNSVGALHNFCDTSTGQCVCREDGVYGRQCDQCQPGFWGFPECRPCQCNGHADICDQKTGACIECRDLTTGHQCDRCQDSYYGDPRLGVDKQCRPCPCPGGPASGKQHADTCYIDPRIDNTVVCNCHQGYVGHKCDKCDVNHWGNPKEVGGQCVKCACNDNIDLQVPDSCHAETGACQKCLWNSVGDQCEHCADGFFGDAKTRSCRHCTCNELGTNSTAGECDRVSGQCPCLPNVVGVNCDACDVNHWKLASGEGCSDCGCDPTGVRKDHDGNPMLQCNELDGQCPCVSGRGGRACDQCEDNFWGSAADDKCEACECDPRGSKSYQCHRETGACDCNENSGGRHCNECARGYTGQWPQCQACGECFQNWDAILSELKNKTETLVHTAENIEDTGVNSVYDEQFKTMETQLGAVKGMLDSANVTGDDVLVLQKTIDDLKTSIADAREKLNSVDDAIGKSTAGVDEAETALAELKTIAAELDERAADLRENATRLKESDVEGAYNITRESANRSQDAKRLVDGAEGFVTASEKSRREAQSMVEDNAQDFDEQFKANEEALGDLNEQLTTLSAQYPSLNAEVCGAEGDPCDDICGGPTCGVCGGPSCDDGAVTKAETALEFAKKAANVLQKKQSDADDMLKEIREAVMKSEHSKAAAEKAYNAALTAAQTANSTRDKLEKLLTEIDTYLDEERATPQQVRELAQEVLNTTISLTPEEIRALGEQIRSNLTKLENVDAIITETQADLSMARELKTKADGARVRAESIRNATSGVIESLAAAKEAQESASAAITTATGDIETAQEDLKTINGETIEAEESSSGANETLVALQDKLKSVRREFVKIEQDVINARNATDRAQAKVNGAEQKGKDLEEEYEKASNLLEDKTGGSEVPKERAEKLRQRAAQLLERTQKHVRDIDTEQREIDSNEVRLGDYDETLMELNKRMDDCTEKITEKQFFHETCDEYQRK